MAVLLGVLVAASFGSGDFLGGRASRRAPTLTVLMVAQAVAVIGAIVVCASVGARFGARDIGFGVLAGSVNIIGIGLLYQGLAVGRMGVVAPLSAVTGAGVPVIWGLAHGERPSTVVIAGAICAVAAVALITRQPPEPGDGPRTETGVVWGLAAGATLGSSLILYLQTSTRSGLWPVLAARVAAFALVGLALLVVALRGAKLPFPTGGNRNLALGAGFLDVTASTLLLLAVRQGLLVVVSPLAALAPGFTVILARATLGEKLHRAQLLGLVLALVGLVLVAVG